MKDSEQIGAPDALPVYEVAKGQVDKRQDDKPTQ